MSLTPNEQVIQIFIWEGSGQYTTDIGTWEIKGDGVLQTKAED